MPKFKNSNATFWVIFKHCAVDKGKVRIFFILQSGTGQKLKQQATVPTARVVVSLIEPYDCQSYLRGYDDVRLWILPNHYNNLQYYSPQQSRSSMLQSQSKFTWTWTNEWKTFKRYAKIQIILLLAFTLARCLKITEKVSFNIASEASYVYILSGQKLI